MNWSGIIFDLDGVICSTDEYHFRAWSSIAHELHVYFDETINDRLRGVSRMESLDIILEQYKGPPLSLHEKESIASRKNNLYRDSLKQMSRADLSAEVMETLDTLRHRGYLMAIGSSSKNAPFILAQLGLNTFFDAISDGNNVTASKPHPEVFLKAADYLSLPAERCLVVEDAMAGVEAAHAAGMKAAVVGDAARQQAGDYLLSRFSDLLNLLPPKA